MRSRDSEYGHGARSRSSIGHCVDRQTAEWDTHTRARTHTHTHTRTRAWTERPSSRHGLVTAVFSVMVRSRSFLGVIVRSWSFLWQGRAGERAGHCGPGRRPTSAARVRAAAGPGKLQRNKVCENIDR